MQVTDWGGNAPDSDEAGQRTDFRILDQSRIPGSVVAGSLSVGELQGVGDSENVKKTKRSQKSKNAAQKNELEVEQGGEILDFPVADIPVEDVDIQKQLEFLEKQKQIE